MQKIKTVFFGTEQFAVAILEGLLSCPFIQIVGVVTQPDQPVGRKQILTAPPTKVWAEQHHIPVFQPEKLKEFDFSSLECDINIVAQYGKIIPNHIIEAPKYKTLNVHTSLLPKYRGASPIQTALINGEQETGVTIMLMSEDLDTGPILLQKKTTIEPDETYLELNARLATVGAEALLETLPLYIQGDLSPTLQNEKEATFSKILTREDGKIDWEKTAQQIYNQYRGLTPWPGIWTTFSSKRLKLLEIKLSSLEFPPGQIHIQDEKMYIGTAKGSIAVVSLQLEGKQAMTMSQFLNGHKDIQNYLLV